MNIWAESLARKREHYIETLQACAYGERTDMTDPKGLVTDIVKIAQDNRRRSMMDVISHLLDNLLGPERRLPEIVQRPRG